MQVPQHSHARIQKVLSEGVQLWQVFFLVWWGEEGSKYHSKRTIISPPAKRHLNGVSLACRWWLYIECGLGSVLFLRGSGLVLLRNPIFLWFFRGDLDPRSPPLDPHMSQTYVHDANTTWYILIQLCIILQEITNLLSSHSFWQWILINLRIAHYGQLIFCFFSNPGQMQMRQMQIHALWRRDRQS